MDALLNDPTLYYKESGGAGSPSLVFLHGFPFDHSMWDAQAALAGPLWRVLTYDQRGHGRSEVGDGQYIFEQYVDDLFALMDAKKIEKAVLCGLSMGGYVALRAVERAPERVSALVLCHTRSDADGNEAKLRRATALKVIRTQGLSVFAEGFLSSIFAPESLARKIDAVDRIRRVILSHKTPGVCGALIALATRTDTTANLPNIRVPALIVTGEKDAIAPPAAARAMHERLPGSRLAIIPQAAHMSPLENPDAFNAALLDFLKALR